MDWFKWLELVANVLFVVFGVCAALLLAKYWALYVNLPT